MIRKLRLVNWKSHLESELDFSEGVNVLVGIMGSGKTSAVQAISFALYGTFPLLQSRKTSLDNIIMRKPQRKERAEVEVWFSLGGKEYSVKRVVARGKGTAEAEIRENGRILNVNAQGVTEEVERILGMDYELFSKAVYAEQNNLDYFLRIPKGQRMAHIDRMLRLDRFEKVREAAVSLTNRLRHAEKEISRVVEDMEKEGLPEKRDALRKELEEVEGKISEARKGLEKAGREVESLSSKVKEFEGKERELGRVSASLSATRETVLEMEESIRKRKEALGREKPDAKSIEAAEKRVRKIEERLSELREEERKKREQVASINTRLGLLSKEIEMLREGIPEKEIPDLRKIVIKELGERPEERIAEMEKELEELTGKRYSLSARKESVEKSLAELKRSGSKCPVCESEISDDKRERLISGREREISSIARDIEKIGREIEERRKTVERARELLSKADENERERREVEEKKKEAAEKEEELASLRQYLGDNVKDIEAIKEDAERLESERKKALERLERMRAELSERAAIEGMENTLNEKRLEIERLEETERKLKEALEGKDIAGMKEELQNMFGEKGRLEAELEALYERKKEVLKSLSDIGERIERMERYRDEAEANRRIAEALSRFSKAVVMTQNQLREEFLKSVNRIMESVWVEIYPYEDIEGVRLAVEGSDYVLQARERSGWVNVEGMASGGERSMALLALRISFSLAFAPNLRWLILDEPTHNLDQNAIAKLSEVFRESLPSLAEQVFLITHEEGLAEAGTGSVYFFRRNKDANGATLVSRMGEDT